MARLNRLPILLLLLVLTVSFAAACGPAEDPADAPAQEQEAEEPEPVEETEAPPVVVEEEPEPAEQEPQLVGNIRLSGEDLQWGNVTQTAAPYTWTVQVVNDTTATLDITVSFQLLDASDRVVKTETAVVRLQPAQTRTIRENGSLAGFDDANRVAAFVATYDYTIVQS